MSKEVTKEPVNQKGCSRETLVDEEQPVGKHFPQILQNAADNSAMKTFHDGLRTEHGSKATDSTLIRSSDHSTLLTTKKDKLPRWAEHFEQTINISEDAIAALPQRLV